MKEKDIHVWKGCNATFAEAINTFSKCWGQYSTKSRRYSIYRLVREQIDPAWLQYLTSLKDIPYGNILIQELPPGEFARRFGFRALEDWTIDIISSYRKQNELANQPEDKEFIPTLETLRTLSARCGGKQPHKTSNGINTLRSCTHCELCGQPTELEAYRLDGADIAMGAFRPSGRYCTEHRPRDRNGRYNASYKRAIRNKIKFENELLRLSRQTGSLTQPRAESGDLAIDLFVMCVVAPQALYADEFDKLRMLARNLVDNRISDNKKRMVILAATGMNQSDIAKHLDISRQAVNKALKTVPPECRFDKLLGVKNGQSTH